MCQALVLIRRARKLGRDERDVLMGCMIMQAGNGERNAFRFMGEVERWVPGKHYLHTCICIAGLVLFGLCLLCRLWSDGTIDYWEKY